MRVFADTGFYVALVNPRDRLHAAALEISNSYRGSVVTTEYVLVELGNYLGGLARQSFIGLVKSLHEDPNTVIVPSSSALFEKGIRFYTERPDKAWSLTDCISFVGIEEHGVRDALSFDRHFEQAGFHVLPAP
ncbi:MAG TPA: PIN domain-containing protein [Candidatus Bathyarchaeia archaeon]|nr:PIN domain-containing protein [Candidatus Bathyarchaeia archaeon]